MRPAALALVLSLLSVAAWGTPVRVLLSLEGEGTSKPPISISLHATGGKPGEQTAGPWPVQVPGEKMLDLPEGVTWTIAAKADGYWSEPAAVLLREGVGAEAALRLFPAGALKGRLEVPPGDVPPSELAVRFQPAPVSGKSKGPAATVTCPVRDRA